MATPSSTSLVKNIYVQLLPIIKRKLKRDEIEQGKILLVKWTHGNFQNRFTGMIKATEFQADNPSTHSKLSEIARNLLPVNSGKIQSLDLVAILEFTDPPACDEYVFVANLQEDEVKNTSLQFENSPCFWFDFDKIPFHEMPLDDAIWYPQVLNEGKLIRGSFSFGSWEEKEIKNYWIKQVDGF